MKKLVVLLMMLAMALSISACNMLSGAGEDIEEVGDSVQDAFD